jgi:group I intron endonuclease
MIIYTLTNTINGKQYVGKTMVTAMKRFQQHKSEVRKGSQTTIHRAIRKYGSEVFLIETIDVATDKESLNQKERDWIVKLNTIETGYNMKPGGEGYGHKHSEATKQKLRECRVVYFQKHPEARLQAAEWAKQAKLTEEGRARKREQMRGNQYAVGMTYSHSDEAKAAIGRAHKGKILSETTKEKMFNSRHCRLSKL